MGKLPSLQFYPADWRKDPGIQALSYHDRGVWFEMLCIMHESEKRGFLQINGKKIPENAISMMLGLDKQKLTKTLSNLRDLGVFSEDENGVIYCRRMVRDEEIRQIRREAGLKGGNPNLLKQNSTPSIEGEDEDEDSKKKGESEGKGKRAPACPYKKIQDLYNLLVPSLPEVSTLGRARKSHMLARWKERPDLKEWTTYFKKVEASDFLCGRTGKANPWSASFDWLMKETNWIKVLEGNYDDGRRGDTSGTGGHGF